MDKTSMVKHPMVFHSLVNLRALKHFFFDFQVIIFWGEVRPQSVQVSGVLKCLFFGKNLMFFLKHSKIFGIQIMPNCFFGVFLKPKKTFSQDSFECLGTGNPECVQIRWVHSRFVPMKFIQPTFFSPMSHIQSNPIQSIHRSEMSM